ncbi:MAG: hypothetical protein ACFB0C_20885 [Leptolyngbyaceae cyanobacterium]
MAAKIGAGQASANPALQTFIDAPTFEAQCIAIVEYAETIQKAHNEAVDPGTGELVNADNLLAFVGAALGTAPSGDFIAAANMGRCPLAANAATQLLWDAALPFGFDNELPLAADGADNINDADLNELLGIATLGGQIIWMGARLEALENAAVEAQTITDADTRCRVSADYDSRLAAVALAMPTSTTSIAAAVGSYV